MREEETKVIDGHRYTVIPLPATRGLRLFNRAVRVLGPALGAIMGDDGEPGDALDRKIDFGRVAAALSDVSDADLEHITSELASHTTVIPRGGTNGQKLAAVFDVHFAGDVIGMFKWAAFALEVNFGDFSGVLSIPGKAQDRDQAKTA
jgi:hypothetical protein